MSAIGLRLLFACLLLATLASKMHASYAGQADIGAALVTLLADKGLAPQLDRSTQLGASVRFEAPGYHGTVHVMPTSLSLEVTPLFSDVAKTGYALRFVYLDRTWFTEERMAMWGQWLKWKALSLWGLGPYVTVPTALIVAAPAGCRFVEDIDWRPVWHESRLSAAAGVRN
jgi:hypothetical protein